MVNQKSKVETVADLTLKRVKNVMALSTIVGLFIVVFYIEFRVIPFMQHDVVAFVKDSVITPAKQRQIWSKSAAEDSDSSKHYSKEASENTLYNQELIKKQNRIDSETLIRISNIEKALTGKKK